MANNSVSRLVCTSTLLAAWDVFLDCNQNTRLTRCPEVNVCDFVHVVTTMHHRLPGELWHASGPIALHKQQL